MSVPKSKRGKSDLEVVTKANDLAAYTIHICSNEKYFPKRYRWCITAKIVDSVIDISQYILMGNSVYVGEDKEMYHLRKSYQTKALATTYALLAMMGIAYCAFGIDGERMEYWTGKVVEVQNLLRNWRKSDSKRYENLK